MTLTPHAAPVPQIRTAMACVNNADLQVAHLRDDRRHQERTRTLLSGECFFIGGDVA
jgi:hypothetical protein